MKRPLVIAWATSIALAAAPSRAAIDYAQPGPHSFTTTDITAGTAGAAAGKLVVPNDAGPFPLLVASHGWSASADNQVGWAEHFASYGFVVAVPTFPNTLSPDANVDAQIIGAMIALYANPATASPAQGKVDPSRVGLEGHSAGGLATTLAARAVTPGAIALFDPVDANDAGRAAYADLCGPMLALFTTASSCNAQAEWSTFATQTAARGTTMRVVGATHCDGENADRGAACGLACGGAATKAHQDVFARYATAFFLANLAGDAQAAATLAPGALSADTSIADVLTTPGTTCAGTSDGGTVGVDGGGAGPSGGDAAAPPPSSAGPPPTTASSDAGANDAPGAAQAAAPSDRAGGGCGCALARRASVPSWWWASVATSMAALIARARRRRDRQPAGGGATGFRP